MRFNVFELASFCINNNVRINRVKTLENNGDVIFWEEEMKGGQSGWDLWEKNGEGGWGRRQGGLKKKKQEAKAICQVDYFYDYEMVTPGRPNCS